MLIRSLFVLLCSLTVLALADEQSGPGRTTLDSFTNGTIYVVTNQVTASKSGLGETVLTTPKGKVKITSLTEGGFKIAGPDGTRTVTDALGEVKITDGKTRISVRSEFGEKTVVDVPGYAMTFQKSLGESKVSGADGVLKVTTSLNEVKLVSPVGTTVMKSELDGASRNGPSIDSHPYTYRALLFERNGVGILLNPAAVSGPGSHTISGLGSGQEDGLAFPFSGFFPLLQVVL